MTITTTSSARHSLRETGMQMFHLPRRRMLELLVYSVSCWNAPIVVWAQHQAQQVSIDQDGTIQSSNTAVRPQSCASWSGAECSWEPNLKPMTVDFGGVHQEIFYAYMTPDVATFYNETAGSRTVVSPRFSGMFGKFINLSPDYINVYWDAGSSKAEDRTFITRIEPFGSGGTATYVSHTFVVTPTSNPSNIIMRWTMAKGISLYYYDPFGSYQKASKVLKDSQLTLYNVQKMNQHFAEQYEKFTGRPWLALYKQKLPPRFHMWRADSFGQTHTVETKEIHFTERPPDHELVRGASSYGPRPDEIARVRMHRDRYPTMNMTLKVLSCAPRVFEIRNFLSDTEVEHILGIAGVTKFHRSETYAGTSDTRTSQQNWIPRSTDIITDAIYRRAADLLQMDESLLRWRRATEIPEFTESRISVAERLQLVKYTVGQQYTPHHDFVMPAMVHLQPSRFATILFYLNDDMEGGETSFPRWVNAETWKPLVVKPERGKAILFYSLLPDGNYDDLSQHAALPVDAGEKYLTNLWIWDPVLDHTAADHI